MHPIEVDNSTPTAAPIVEVAPLDGPPGELDVQTLRSFGLRHRDLGHQRRLKGLARLGIRSLFPGALGAGRTG